MLSIAPVERSSSTWIPVAAPQQLVGKVRADEAGATGDENAHVFNLCRAPPCGPYAAV